MHITLEPVARRAMGAAVLVVALAAGSAIVPLGSASAVSTTGARIEGDGTSCSTGPAHSTVSDAVAAAAPGDVIHICAGSYSEPEIVVTVDDLTIVGEGSVVLDGGATLLTRHRIIDATGLTLTLENLTLGFGRAVDSGGAVKGFEVTIIDSVLRDNDAPSGGAIFVSAEDRPSETPSVTIVDSVFEDNGDGESAVYGGAVYAMGGTVTVSGSTFDGNEAMSASTTLEGAGGAILAETVAVEGSTFVRNRAMYHGGAISAATVTITSSDADPRVGSRFEANTVNWPGNTLREAYGGAVWAYSVDVSDAHFAANVADVGGAIAVSAPAVDTSGDLVVRSSTFSDNRSSIDGGAVVNIESTGSTAVTASTFVGNVAGRAGGAVASYAPFELDFSTFVANAASVSGGVFWTPSTPVTATNNIFVVEADDAADGPPNGCQDWGWNPFVQSGNLTTNEWCPGDPVDEEQLDLGTLADNGGPTPTIPLGDESVAIDAVATDVCDAVSGDTDQRGVARPVGLGCDVGAFESDAPPVLNVCLERLSVRYGAERFRPSVVLCVPDVAPQRSAGAPDNAPDSAPDSGIPAGWRIADPAEFPGVVPPTCTADYRQGMSVQLSPRTITCSGGDPGGYVFDSGFITGLTIRPAVLRVRPERRTVAPGSPEPRYRYAILGYRLDDKRRDLESAPRCDSDYTPTASAGTRFVITCVGGSAVDYVFRYYKAALVVAAVPTSAVR